MAAKLVLRVVDVVLAVLARLLFLLFAYSCGWSLLTKAELDAARWSADDSRPPIEDASALFLHDLDDLDDLDDDDDAKKKRKREKADAELEDRVAAMLRARGSSSTPHLDGVTLDDHLSHVASILKRWRAPRSIVVAGLAHTAFGSEFLPVRAMPFASRRVAEETCGAWAERMMFLYGTASQSKLYRAVMREREDEEEEEEDDARKNSPHHHRFEVTNVYTNETMPLTHAEAGFLLMMHAADVASTIFASKKNLRIKTHPTARTYYRGAFAIHALRRAARRFRLAAAEASEEGPFVGRKEKVDAYAALAAACETDAVREIVDASMPRLQEPTLERRTRRLRGAWTDAWCAFRCVGVIDMETWLPWGDPFA